MIYLKRYKDESEIDYKARLERMFDQAHDKYISNMFNGRFKQALRHLQRSDRVSRRLRKLDKVA